MIANSAGTPVLGTNSNLKRMVCDDLAEGDRVRIRWTVPNVFSDGPRAWTEFKCPNCEYVWREIYTITKMDMNGVEVAVTPINSGEDNAHTSEPSVDGPAPDDTEAGT